MRSILQHLRLPFSFLLMPVFLFALCSIDSYNLFTYNVGLLFFILHFLVYPSSNAYNSTQDRDEGSVGLIKNPLPIPKCLFLITVVLDFVAIIFSLFINLKVCLLIIIYILASRLYSWRKIRLKKYPIVGFLTVFICQGALVFFIVILTISPTIFSSNLLTSYIVFAFVSSLFIGSIYPLSQIYQHEQDRNDGVKTISALLGYKGTFLFSGIQFMLASTFIFSFLFNNNKWEMITIYFFFQLPVIAFFLYWFYKVMKNNLEANFKNTMYMNLISATSMNVCFAILLFFK